MLETFAQCRLRARARHPPATVRSCLCSRPASNTLQPKVPMLLQCVGVEGFSGCRASTKSLEFQLTCLPCASVVANCKNISCVPTLLILEPELRNRAVVRLWVVCCCARSGCFSIQCVAPALYCAHYLTDVDSRKRFRREVYVTACCGIFVYPAACPAH